MLSVSLHMSPRPGAQLKAILWRPGGRNSLEDSAVASPENRLGQELGDLGEAVGGIDRDISHRASAQSPSDRNT